MNSFSRYVLFFFFNFLCYNFHFDIRPLINHRYATFFYVDEAIFDAYVGNLVYMENMTGKHYVYAYIGQVALACTDIFKYQCLLCAFFTLFWRIKFALPMLSNYSNLWCVSWVRGIEYYFWIYYLPVSNWLHQCNNVFKPAHTAYQTLTWHMH